MKPNAEEPTPEAQLRSCIDRLEPKLQKLARAVRAALRKRFPTLNELAYDYSDSVVIGYSPTDKGIEAIVALAARATGVFLYFNQGPQLPDPQRLLQGAGKQTRFVQLETASRLAHPDVDALIGAAVDQSRIALPAEGQGSLIIKSSAAKKRSRQKPTQ